jgi:hypothetical protein
MERMLECQPARVGKFAVIEFVFLRDPRAAPSSPRMAITCGPHLEAHRHQKIPGKVAQRKLKGKVTIARARILLLTLHQRAVEAEKAALIRKPPTERFAEGW